MARNETRQMVQRLMRSPTSSFWRLEIWSKLSDSVPARDRGKGTLICGKFMERLLAFATASIIANYGNHVSVTGLFPRWL